ncbi:unnamed protein product, partial [Bubo scandiacus]
AHFIVTCSRLLATPPEAKVSDAKQDQDQAEQRSDPDQKFLCSKSCVALSQSAYSSPFLENRTTDDCFKNQQYLNSEEAKLLLHINGIAYATAALQAVMLSQTFTLGFTISEMEVMGHPITSHWPLRASSSKDHFRVTTQ